MNKSKVIKMAAVATAVAVTVTSVGYFEFRSSETEVSADTSEVQQKIEDSINNIVSTSTATGTDKEETVYVISDANGKVQKKIVSDWLKNKNSEDTISDKSDLKDIENVKGDEKYTEGKDGELTWNAKGSDIYYQGTTDKELPVDVKLTYYLDGKEISAKDISGKSGKVKIRFEYTNNTKKSVAVNGKNTDMYVPFTMISGMLLPADTFTNVEVSDGNGKIITQGKNTVAIGVAFPGLNDNLNNASISDKLRENIADSFEITADVKDFELAMTLTAGTSEVLSAIDPSAFDSLDDVEDTVDKLVDAVNKLTDGSKDLKTGLDKLKDGSAQVNNGVGLLNSKTGEFADGLKTLDDGVALLLTKMNADDGAIAGAKALASGITTIDTKLKDVNDAVGKLSAGANTVDGYAGDIADGVGKLSAGATKLDGSVGTLQTGANTLADKTKTLDDSIGKLQTGTNTLASKTDLLDGNMVKATAGSKKLYSYLNKLSKGIASASDGASGLEKGIGTVLGLLNDFDGNGTKLTDALTQLSTGATAVSDGVGSISDAVNGTDTQMGLKTAADATKTGVEAVGEGIDNLQNTMTSQLQSQIDGNNTKIEAIMSLGASMSDTDKQNLAALKGANQALQGVVDSLSNSSGDAKNPTLKDGFTQLKNGNDQVLTGITGIDNGLAQLQNNMTALVDGGKKVSAGVAKLNGTLPTLVGGLTEIGTGINSLSTGLNTMKTSSGELTGASKTLYSSLDKLQKQGTGVLSSTINQLATDKKEGIPALKAGTGLLSSTLDSLATDKEKGVPALKAGTGTLASNLSTLNDKMGDFTDGTGQLASNLSTLNTALPALKDGTSSAATGMNTLLTGLTTLSETVGTKMKPGLDTLYSGGLTLKSSVATLFTYTQQIATGVATAANGSGTLADGISQLKSEAVDPVADAMNGDLDEVVDRIKQSVTLADDYNIYSSAEDGKDTSVKFIYKTDGINCK